MRARGSLPLREEADRDVLFQREAALALDGLENAADDGAGRMGGKVLPRVLVERSVARLAQAEIVGVERRAERLHHPADVRTAGPDGDRDLHAVLRIRLGPREEAAGAGIGQRCCHVALLRLLSDFFSMKAYRPEKVNRERFFKKVRKK